MVRKYRNYHNWFGTQSTSQSILIFNLQYSLRVSNDFDMWKNNFFINCHVDELQFLLPHVNSCYTCYHVIDWFNGSISNSLIVASLIGWFNSRVAAATSTFLIRYKIVNRSLVVQGLRWTVWAERTTWRPMGRPMGRWWIDKSMYWSIRTDVIDVIKNLCITNWDMMIWWLYMTLHKQ